MEEVVEADAVSEVAEARVAQSVAAELRVGGVLAVSGLAGEERKPELDRTAGLQETCGAPSSGAPFRYDAGHLVEIVDGKADVGAALRRGLPWWNFQRLPIT